MGHEVLQIVDIQNATDAAGDGRRVGDDCVGGGGQVVATAGADVHQASDDRQAGARFEGGQIARHDVGGRDAAARRVDAHDDSADMWITLDGIEPLAKDRDRILAPRAEAGRIRVEQKPVHIDDGDGRAHGLRNR